MIGLECVLHATCMCIAGGRRVRACAGRYKCPCTCPYMCIGSCGCVTGWWAGGGTCSAYCTRVCVCMYVNIICVSMSLLNARVCVCVCVCPCLCLYMCGVSVCQRLCMYMCGVTVCVCTSTSSVYVRVYMSLYITSYIALYVMRTMPREAAMQDENRRTVVLICHLIRVRMCVLMYEHNACSSSNIL